VNSSNIHISQYAFNDSYLSGLSPGDDFVDFGAAPSSFKTDTDMDFDSPSAEPAFFYPEQSTTEFVDPSTIGSNHGLPTSHVPTQSTSNVGRLWPGMHQQQAALAKAQAQQKQQQQIIQQQRQAAMGGPSRAGSQRPRGSHPPTDPIVEEKISQLLNSMRQSSVSTEDNDAKTPGNVSHARMRKDEEEMDEDERLLASEEGKKLSSKERR
jgi:bZIP-type transcription factor MBZ1